MDHQLAHAHDAPRGLTRSEDRPAALAAAETVHVAGADLPFRGVHVGGLYPDQGLAGAGERFLGEPAAWFADSRHKQGMQALDHDLTIIKAVDPIPDPQAQELWSSALTRGQDRLLNGDTDYSAVVARLGSGFGVAPTATPS